MASNYRAAARTGNWELSEQPSRTYVDLRSKRVKLPADLSEFERS